MSEEPWYAAKCIFRHDDLAEKDTVYEERIVLFKANSFEEAKDLAEAEAKDYIANCEGKTTCTDFMNIFHLFDNEIKSGTEIYSVMRTSDKSESDFLDHYYDDGTEHTQTFN